MSTPAGNMQQSSTATYTQAIETLEQAKNHMTTIQGQVLDAKSNLQSRYSGADGQAYSQVMQTWLEEVDRIKNTCEAMQNQLGNSMQASSGTQSENLQAVYDQGKLTPFGATLGVDDGIDLGSSTYATLTGH
ncbi:WXG100 family type VII secretion target [Streptomyces canus]|uniref:WXG100 family type VII secretion target n=1 Tax=Streptomyces canus TaxID=58343 RepID=UPI0033EDC29B